MKIDFSKPVQTVNGEAVRIYATDCGGCQPVQGAWYDDEEGVWVMEKWTIEGRAIGYNSSSLNLINVPTHYEFERWVNVYFNKQDSTYTCGFCYRSEDEAKRVIANPKTNRICVGTIRIVIKGEHV